MLLRRNRYINNLKENILETRVEGKEEVERFGWSTYE